MEAVQAGRSERCDEELEGADWEMSAAAGSRERDPAGLRGDRKLDWGSGPGAVAGPGP